MKKYIYPLVDELEPFCLCYFPGFFISIEQLIHAHVLE